MLWIIAGTLGMISFLLTIAVFRIQKKNIRLKIALAETTREKTEKEVELEKIECEKAEAKQKLETLQNMYNKRNNEMQISLLEKLGIIKDIALLNPKQTSSVKFINDVNTIISKITMEKFVGITNELYPDFTRKLNDNFPNSNLTEQETGVCCLIFCGFSNKELALFIHKKKDTQTVEKIKNRIRKKLNIPAYRDIQKFISDNITGE
jgi:ATP/maltotriose-dependent transcriptional regulator MalT